MPVESHGFFGRDELAAAETGRFLGHTYNIPLYKIPQKGRAPHRHGLAEGEPYVASHDLYDLAADPAQEHLVKDDALDARFRDLARTELARVKAPEENLARLGLD
jgi:hypothetical protein